MIKGTVISLASNVSSNGTYCTCIAALPVAIPPSGTISEILDVFDSGYYQFVSGAGVSAGAVGVNLLQLSPSGSPVWTTATIPNAGGAFTLVSAFAASTNYNGSLNVSSTILFPCLGIQLVVSGLTGGSVTLQLNLTKR